MAEPSPVAIHERKFCDEDLDECELRCAPMLAAVRLDSASPRKVCHMAENHSASFQEFTMQRERSTPQQEELSELNMMKTTAWDTAECARGNQTGFRVQQERSTGCDSEIDSLG